MVEMYTKLCAVCFEIYLPYIFYIFNTKKVEK